MDLESNYGSSEYSAEAEQLFAKFLVEMESGTAPDFEEFCAEHDAEADELYGLHADWDNVRGLLALLKSQQKGEDPALEQAAKPGPLTEVQLPEEPELTTTPVVPAASEESPAKGGWKFVSAAAILSTMAIGAWTFSLLESSEVLASENKGLELEGQAQQRKLEDAHRNEAQLAKAGKALEGELATARNEQDELNKHSEDLARDLQSEREDKIELEEREITLAKELKIERDLALRTSDDAKRFAFGVAESELYEREQAFWPAKAANLDGILVWLTDAQSLAKSQSALAESGELSAHISRNQTRYSALSSWREEQRQSWSSAQVSLADTSLFPAFGGLQLEIQFGMQPIGIDSKSGLWMFADLQTGESHGQGMQALPAPDTSKALIFLLVPGIEIEGITLAPFFVAETECGELQRQRALGMEPSTEELSALEIKLRYELDLARLGYNTLTMIQRDLARQFGVDVTNWNRQPARAVSSNSN
ncbi:MAG: hypothetical protein ACI8X5_001594 [Planctomycetota bacterium]|jgi:hypothetical protein